MNQDLFSETISLLKRYHVRPRKGYSQNFLINPKLIEWHVEFAGLEKEDEVVEIGPGLGFLTEAIARKVKRVISIEIDKRMIRILKDRLSWLDNLEIIESDILKLPTEIFDDKKIISNTPYGISSPLLFKVFKSRYKLGLFTFQEEFARRLAARPGDLSYGRLSASAARFAEVKILKNISRRWFYPKPKVNSILLLIKPCERPPSTIPSSFFDIFLRDLFSYKNKNLRNALKFMLKRWNVEKEEIKAILSDLASWNKVVKDLSPEELETLASLIHEKLGDIGRLEGIGL
ncbi:MAG: 16S rRNA (adenine(1518)-N(6)/adenine(1519)-N(6))-dimethyltransferase RsmA [Candidatus Helarchaeales archaeon]